MKCPICDSKGTLHEKVSMIRTQPLPNNHIVVPLHFFECSHCGEEVELPEQLRENDKRLRHAKIKWLAENLSNRESLPAMLRELRSLFGVSQKQFSKVIGATGTAVSKYELGTVEPSSMAMKLLTLIALNPEIYYKLQEIDEEEEILLTEWYQQDTTASDHVYLLLMGQTQSHQIGKASSQSVPRVHDFHSIFEQAIQKKCLSGPLGAFTEPQELIGNFHSDLTHGENSISVNIHPGYFLHHGCAS